MHGWDNVMRLLGKLLDYATSLNYVLGVFRDNVILNIFFSLFFSDVKYFLLFCIIAIFMRDVYYLVDTITWITYSIYSLY